MTLQLFDTLQGKKVEFKPLKEGEVTMYLCGPTVYNYAHIGNARPAVVFDVLGRLLRRSYKLKFVRNFTDVDDKINATSIETGKPIEEITAKYITAYNQDMNALSVCSPDAEPRATENIPEMIAMIEVLIKKGFAYESKGHVLFDVSSNENYGVLSKRNLKEMIAGARVEVAPYKKAAHDFVLWKPSTPDLPGWSSPWGRGRPGWHIECSAMAEKYLGKTIDIHAGGLDLVFPHHENEMAQSCCANDGKPFARYWLHNGFLSMNQTKMSKSLGNVLFVHDMLKTIPGEIIRLALLSAHYKQPLDWSDDSIRSARRKLDRLYGALQGINIPENCILETNVPEDIILALEDDLNSPLAISVLFNLARDLNRATSQEEKEKIAALLSVGGQFMGLLKNDPNKWFTEDSECDLSSEEIEELIKKRQTAKDAKDFKTADKIRNQLFDVGINIQDGRDGTSWRRNKL